MRIALCALLLLFQHGATMQLSRRVMIRNAGVAAPFIFTPLALAADDAAKARAQLTSSADAMDDLIKRYDEIVASDGGNGIRRVLGKLGPTSPLHRIDKATSVYARSLEDEKSFDLVDEFLGQLDAADGDAYSSIFVPTGGGTNTEYWLDRSKKEIVKCRATLATILELQ